MSRRRTARSRQVVSSDEEEAGPPPPRAARRAALQLSQSQHASGGTSSAGSALAMLLAGSKPAAPSGGTGAGVPSQAAAGAAAGGSPAASRRRGRATLPRPKQSVPAALAAAAAAEAGGSQQRGAAPQPAAAAAAAAAAELWVEKHAPRSEAELVVHKKKVQEVQEWLEQQRASLGQRGASRLLVVSGPSGCGKTATLATLAAAVGFDVSEWRPPPAVQWEEAQYAGIQRRNKVEEFEEFVVRTKMPHLSLRSSSSSVGSSPAPPAASSGSPTAGLRSSQLPRPSQAAAVEVAAAAAGRGSSGSHGGTQAARPGRLAPSLLPTLVIVDDLPHAAGPEQRRQIAQALGDMAAGARFPVVVVATETSGKAQQERGLSAAAGTYQGLHKELVAVLEAHRATTISFNPFTPLGIAKALKAVLEKERLALPDAEVTAIAEGANGDLHNAIATLQFVCTGAAPAAAPAKGRGKAAAARGTKRKAAGSKAAGAAASAEGEDGSARVAFALRDSSLSLFHALGKLLYNKRLPAGAAGGGIQAGQAAPSQQQQQQQQQSSQQQGGQGGVERPGSAKRQWTANGFWLPSGAQGAPPGLPLAAWAQRAPMEFDPEAVLAGAGLEAGSVTAFLHENILNFIEESAVEDAAACLEALSAADCMAAGRRWGSSEGELLDDDSPSSTLLDAAAASTAARGVCFANAHPAPRRWLPLKAPAVFTVGRGRAANLAELARSTTPAWAVHGGMRSLEPAGRLASELLPYARTLAARGGYPALARLQPARWSRFWNGQLYEQQGGGQPAGGGWEEQEQADALAAAAGAAGSEQHAAEADAIEESEDEDDW